MTKVVNISASKLYSMWHDYSITLGFNPIWRRLFRMKPYQRTYVSQYGIYWFCLETQRQVWSLGFLDTKLHGISKHVEEYITMIRAARDAETIIAKLEEEKALQAKLNRSRFNNL